MDLKAAGFRSLVALLVLATSNARIYLDVHFPLDVTAGFVLGTIGPMAATMIFLSSLRTTAKPHAKRNAGAVATRRAPPMTRPPWWNSRRGLWVLFLTIGWLAFTAWLRPLTLPDEGRYVGVAWDMLRTGDWLTPRLDGLPFFHKPPLFYWITASAMSAFGLHEWPARVASIAGGSAAAFGLFLFVRRWGNAKDALTALIVLLTSPMFFIGAQFANLDMLVAGCISVCVLLFAHAALADMHGNESRGFALSGGYFALALAVLAKGLIGIVLPGLIIVLWLGLLRQFWVLARLVWLPGIALFAIVTVPWFVLMQVNFPEFFHYFFVVQHFQRFTAGGFNNHQPFFFYPLALLLFGLPWTPWLFNGWRVGTREPVRRPQRMLMVVWLAVVVVFFSVPQSKLIGYVLPALPPLAFLLAEGLQTFLRDSSRPRRALWPKVSALIAALVCVIAALTLALLPLSSSRVIGQALLKDRQPGEQVVFVGNYYYDVAFYAHLVEPIAVAMDWKDKRLTQSDNWIKEFADAARFAPPTTASRTLLLTADLTRSLCSRRVSWIVAPAFTPLIYPFLAAATPIAQQSGSTLWRLDIANPSVSQALHCLPAPALSPAPSVTIAR